MFRKLNMFKLKTHDLVNIGERYLCPDCTKLEMFSVFVDY